jgi:hypothetical protein
MMSLVLSACAADLRPHRRRLFSAMSLLANARLGRRQPPILMDESRIRRRSQLHLQAVHTLLMPPVEAVALQCRPVHETPIYDQLRDEGINAEVAPSRTAPSRGGRPRRHRPLADTTDPIEMGVLPGPAADPVAHQHPVPERADQPPDATQQTAAVPGPQATVLRLTHARHTRAPAASSSPTATGVSNP